MTDALAKAFGLLGLVILTVLAVGLLVSLPVMWLWNGCLVPAVAGVTEISWLQAWGLMILTSFLFKSNTSSTK